MVNDSFRLNLYITLAGMRMFTVNFKNRLTAKITQICAYLGIASFYMCALYRLVKEHSIVEINFLRVDLQYHCPHTRDITLSYDRQAHDITKNAHTSNSF